ncbi:hypothetical protein AGMMS50249_2400 [candidate division SR1 bacterium]|nr:hypothetical protein AGMMS50249_2400 [candidate division SR1 bacterium]
MQRLNVNNPVYKSRCRLILVLAFLAKTSTINSQKTLKTYRQTPLILRETILFRIFYYNYILKL